MIHRTAVVEDGAQLGKGVNVWAFAQIRSGAVIGRETTIGSHSYIDTDVTIGNRCKVQTGVRLFRGAIVEDGVFLGPGAIVTNDRVPRAITATGSLKTSQEWTNTETRIGRGASVGAGSVIVAGAHIGSFALIGAGTTVTHAVPDYALVVGNPGRQFGWVCHCGGRLEEHTHDSWRCETCHETIKIPSQ